MILKKNKNSDDTEKTQSFWYKISSYIQHNLIFFVTFNMTTFNILTLLQDFLPFWDVMDSRLQLAYLKICVHWYCEIISVNNYRTNRLD